MAESNTGGGGSVQWSIDCKHLKETGYLPFQKTRHTVWGVSGTGREKKDKFTVSIALPEGVSLEQFKKGLKGAGRRVVFKIPITRNPKQITIRWPDARSAD